MTGFAGYAGIVFDLDGVVYRGSEALPGARETVAAVRAAGTGVAFCTNNANRTPAQLAERLTGMGIPAAAPEVITSATAAAALLPPGTRCLVLGGDGVRTALAGRDCPLTDEPEEADAVVVGFTRELEWDDLRRATLALARGARFIGTNADAAFPSTEGLLPGNGAILAALATAAGREPEITGKPKPALFRVAAERLPDGPLLMVGDRHETDIAGAAALGWDTALVLTGVTTRESLTAADPPPTYLLDGVAGLLDLDSQRPGTTGSRPGAAGEGAKRT